MARETKGNQTAKAAKEDPKTLRLQQKPTESKAEMLAHTALRPTVQAALTLMDYNKALGELSVNTLMDDLVKQCELTNNGDLRRAEALLTSQAHTLDAIFHTLARRAQRVEYLNQLDVNLRLALKAQSQCRATLEALAAIKNPQPVAFVRQANIAHGPQQVNNGGAVGASLAGKSENPPNKVLEHQRGERLDVGAASAAGDADSALETVEAVNRPEDARG